MPLMPGKQVFEYNGKILSPVIRISRIEMGVPGVPNGMIMEREVGGQTETLHSMGEAVEAGWFEDDDDEEEQVDEDEDEGKEVAIRMAALLAAALTCQRGAGESTMINKAKKLEAYVRGN